MRQPTIKAADKTLSEEASFDRDYARYQQLSAEMDRTEGIYGKRSIFRQLLGLLDRMESGIGSRTREART
jgi:hypothetical protein